jgi:hypothetical protein
MLPLIISYWDMSCTIRVRQRIEYVDENNTYEPIYLLLEV